LAGVRPGSGAELGGMKAGDVLVQLGDRSIESLHDLKFVLDSSKPHQTVKAAVLRDGKRVETKVTFQEKGGAPTGNPHAAPNGGKDAPAGEKPASGHPAGEQKPAPAPAGEQKPAPTSAQKPAPASAAAPATNPAAPQPSHK
jgi:membrane-associated protease RseP (regulator of RpoE activity)